MAVEWIAALGAVNDEECVPVAPGRSQADNSCLFPD
jgi:hypothetical protein